MKAIVCTHYGPPEVLELRKQAKPALRDNEILVKVATTTVTSGDTRVRSFTIPLSFWLPARLMLGLRKPKKAILGMVLAGEVEAVGKEVKAWKKGDQISAYDLTRLGTYAEYASVPENSAIACKPPTITYEEAAAIPFRGVTALDFLKKGKIQSGQHVLIYGAAGSVGTFAVQLAKYFGAKVTGICSTTNVELVKSLGADRVIDYTREDFSRSGEIYDIIFDTVGKSSLANCLRSLKKEGSYLLQAKRMYCTLLRACGLMGQDVTLDRGGRKCRICLVELGVIDHIVGRIHYLDTNCCVGLASCDEKVIGS